MDERTILALAPSADAFDAGVALVRQGRLRERGRTDDSLLVFAQCVGSGSDPYEVSADLALQPPSLRCSCPSRKRPCKHALALLVALVREAPSFAPGQAPADLVEKSEKARSKQTKASDAPAEAAAATESVTESAEAPKPKKKAASGKASAQAQAKKAQAQLEGIALGERVLEELARAGLGTLDGARLESLRARAKEVADFHLPGLATALRRLVILLAAKESDEKTLAPAARQLARLWAMVKKGRALLEQKAGGEAEAQGENEAMLEELLGKVWQLAELKERGFVRAPLSLVELAYSRMEDEAREERVETSWMLDLASGEILRHAAFVPQRRVKQEQPKSSFEHALQLSEAVVYPGLGNRRVRWEETALQTRPFTDADRLQIVGKAIGLSEAAGRLQAQVKNPLAPEGLVQLVQVARVGKVGEALVLEDAQGARLAVADDELAQEARRVLEVTGWPAGASAMLVALVADFETHRIAARPMTVVAPAGLLRLTL